MSKKEEKKVPSAEGEAPKSKKKLVIILVAVLVLLAGVGGGAAWFFLVKNKPHQDEKKKKKEVEATASAIFVPLDRFTVNLVQENGDQVLQLGVTLKTYDAEMEEKVKKATPEIRSRLLELLSSKRASQLSTVAGKKRLTAEILYLVNRTLGFKKPAPPPDLVMASTTATGVAETVVAPATGGLAAALQQAQPKPEALAPPPKPVAVTDLLPEQSDKGEDEDRDGVVDVLYTDFIIQ